MTLNIYSRLRLYLLSYCVQVGLLITYIAEYSSKVYVCGGSVRIKSLGIDMDLCTSDF
jgi:hypothetical protein